MPPPLRKREGLHFTVRSLFVATLVVAICVANWQTLYRLSFGYFYPLAMSLAAISWWSAQRVFALPTRAAHRGRLSWVRISLAVVVVACVLSVWCRHRWIASYYDDGWPRGWPYPDELLLSVHDWIDLKYPAGPGEFRIHGEIYTVWRYLNLISLALCTAAGGLLGCVVQARHVREASLWIRRRCTRYPTNP